MMWILCDATPVALFAARRLKPLAALTLLSNASGLGRCPAVSTAGC